MNASQIQTIASEFAKFETIPMSMVPKLQALLNSADNKALKLVVKNRIKFCWMIAVRILRERGVKVVVS